VLFRSPNVVAECSRKKFTQLENLFKHYEGYERFRYACFLTTRRVIFVVS
jgi:hypothetical protein